MPTWRGGGGGAGDNATIVIVFAFYEAQAHIIVEIQLIISCFNKLLFTSHLR